MPDVIEHLPRKRNRKTGRIQLWLNVSGPTYCGAAIVAIHPGTTNTNLSRPFQKNVRAEKLYSPEQTASRLLGVLDEIDETHSGSFLNWDGSTIPW